MTNRLYNISLFQRTLETAQIGIRAESPDKAQEKALMKARNGEIEFSHCDGSEVSVAECTSTVGRITTSHPIPDENKGSLEDLRTAVHQTIDAWNDASPAGLRRLEALLKTAFNRWKTPFND